LKARTIVIVVVVIVDILVDVVAYEVLTAPGPVCTSTWNCGADYPIQIGGTYGINGQQCIGGAGYLECIGGQDANGGSRSNVYSAVLSSSGNITGWTASSNQYPSPIYAQSCTAGLGYVYCVGGTYDGQSGDDLASSYYAPLNSSGAIGTWASTTPYPIPVDTQSCVTSSGYIYCIAGNNETGGEYEEVVPTSSVWYAPISDSGIGTWSQTTSYPADDFFPDCFTAGGYVYCIGGADSNGNSLTTSYYAPLTASGVGSWTSTAPYPVAASGQACAISSGEIYCIGGETAGGNTPSFTNGVYYAPISSGGIGTWKQSPNYPDSTLTNCAITTGYLYCVGGLDSSSVSETYIVNYASLSALAG